MTNRYYPKGAEKTFSGGINYVADTIKAALVPDTYTFSMEHEFASDLGTLVGQAQELTGRSVTGGVFDANDVDFGSLAAGATVKAVVLFKDTGNATTSPLICYLDQVTGLPFSTNGGMVQVPWSNGAAKIISLVP